MESDVLERFLRYVKIDTQSAYGAGDKYPSTDTQKDLSRLLVYELKEMGLDDAVMDDCCYVTATLPSNLPDDFPNADKVPVLGLIAHVDTSPDVSGANVKPIVHENYDGGDLILPGDPNVVIRVEMNPYLLQFKGRSIVTADGTTLLGADDKAGVAEIMAMLKIMTTNPSIKHGTLKIGFTPDEEIGDGTKYFDIEKFGADVAFTVDGDDLGCIEDENFNASKATITIKGRNHHPGYAKGKMINALRIASHILCRLPLGMAPETTEGREGFIHPHTLDGGVDEMTLKLIIRDFEWDGLKEKEALLVGIVDETKADYPKATVNLVIEESYRNMRDKIVEIPGMIDCAIEAIKSCGIEPLHKPIRGGTDGARLSYMGLPTPNLFTGGHNFHSTREFIPVDAMDKAVEVLLKLCDLCLAKTKNGK